MEADSFWRRVDAPRRARAEIWDRIAAFCEEVKGKGLAWWRGIDLAVQVDEVDEGRPKSGIHTRENKSRVVIPKIGLPSSTSSTYIGVSEPSEPQSGIPLFSLGGIEMTSFVRPPWAAP